MVESLCLLQPDVSVFTLFVDVGVVVRISQSLTGKTSGECVPEIRVDSEMQRLKRFHWPLGTEDNNFFRHECLRENNGGVDNEIQMREETMKGREECVNGDGEEF